MNYVGKKLSECPDGTVAVVTSDIAQLATSPRVRCLMGGKVGKCDAQFNYKDAICDEPSTYTVHTILKLGKPRPKTFADEEAGVAWRNDEGKLRWRGDGNELLYCDSGFHPVHAGFGADMCKILDSYTRAGRVRVVLDPL